MEMKTEIDQIDQKSTKILLQIFLLTCSMVSPLNLSFNFEKKILKNPQKIR